MTIDRRLESLSVTLNLNNEGAGLLNKGDHKAAISVFSRALYACRDSINGSSNPSDGKLCQEEHSRFIGLDSFMDMSDDGNGMDLVEDDQPYIYLHPLIIPTAVSKAPSESTLSGILIFNLALAHHQ
jgi:hypothetical protein